MIHIEGHSLTTPSVTVPIAGGGAISSTTPKKPKVVKDKLTKDKPIKDKTKSTYKSRQHMLDTYSSSTNNNSYYDSNKCVVIDE